MENVDIYRARNSLRRDSVWRADDILSLSSRDENDEEELKWAALEKLPTFDRLRKELLTTSRGRTNEIDVHDLGPHERKSLMEKLLRVANEDNERFLMKLRNRIERVGITNPTIEVRFERLNVEAETYVGSRALPYLRSSTSWQI